MENKESFDLIVPKDGELTRNAWSLPVGMTEQDWADAGKKLVQVDDAYSWWLGDWWAYGSAAYGERKAVVESEDWNGPAYQTCKDVAWVCSEFERSRRRDLVPFSHHREVAALPYEEQEQVLNWCESEHRVAGRVPTRAALREKVKQIKAWLAQGWTQSQLERKLCVEDGETVVASKRKDANGKEIDAALIAWADQRGLVVMTDRTSEWGNPFEMGADGTRDEVCENYANHYLPFKPSLQKKLKQLKGKVLVCWCHPERCHAHHLASIVNEIGTGF